MIFMLFDCLLFQHVSTDFPQMHTQIGSRRLLTQPFNHPCKDISIWGWIIEHLCREGDTKWDGQRDRRWNGGIEMNEDSDRKWQLNKEGGGTWDLINRKSWPVRVYVFYLFAVFVDFALVSLGNDVFLEDVHAVFGCVEDNAFQSFLSTIQFSQ